MPNQQSPFRRGVVELRNAMKGTEGPLRKLHALTKASKYDTDGQKKKFEIGLRAARAVHESLKSLTFHADKVWQTANAQITVALHNSALEATRLARAAGENGVVEAVEEATHIAAEAVEHSREGLARALTQILDKSPVVGAGHKLRPDEWLKGLVSDQVPWSATIQNALKAAFDFDLDAVMWEKLAEEGRRDLSMRVRQAVALEVDLALIYANTALHLAVVAQGEASKRVGKQRGA